MKFWRKYHKWAGIVLSFFLLLFAVSGIILNHRSLFSNIDVPRSILSSSYQYKNWNNAALKGGIDLDSTTTLFYGNVGCWQYDKINDQWTDFNIGFPNGIDNRKISKLLLTQNKRLFAGTLFGLYEYNGDKWQAVGLLEDKITDIIEVNNQLHVLTRDHLLTANVTNKQVEFRPLTLPTPSDFNNKSSLFKTIWILHSGEAFGTFGKLLVDALAIVLIFLAITGLIWFTFPSLIKKAKAKLKPRKRKQKAFKFSVEWHNKIGYYTVILLIFTTFTGIFLRPPLLIAIANAQVPRIPFTVLASENPWYNQLRSIRYNSKYDVYFVSTSKGMYALTADYKEMVKIPHQPPVSVMGINAFEEIDAENYLVGSFSGLYLWNPFANKTLNYLSGKPYSAPIGMSRPIGQNMVSGYYKNSGSETYFDYNSGHQLLGGKANMPNMPSKVLTSAPISLWNLALEVHTARIFQDLIGAFYILIIPLSGLATIALLISGWWIYLKRFKRKIN